MASILRLLLLIGFLCAISLLPAVAQEEEESDWDRVVSVPDNPLGRGEYERLKRADPRTGKIPEGIRSRELAFAAGIPSRESLVAQGEGKRAGVAALVGTWHPRGPVNQGGRTRALAIDRTNEAILLAGGVSGGMWRSRDNGRTWERTTAIDQIHSVTCLTQDPRPGAANIWYYGTGEWRANSADLPGDGIFKSVDGGLTWTRLAATVRNTPQTRDQIFDYVHRIAVDPSNLDQDELYAACYGAIARSVDGGETWEPVLGSLLNGASYTDVAVTSGGVLYATLSSNGRTQEGIWRSEDGINWTNITPANFPGSFSRIAVGIAPSNESLVYFFAETPNSGTNGHSLWVYHAGESEAAVWEERSAALPANVESYASYCLTVRVKPDDENVVFLGHVQCHRSTDGFRDTANVTVQMGYNQHADQHDYVFFPSNPNKMLAGHDGGISLVEDNLAEQLEWQSLNRTFITTQFYTVAVDHAVEGSDVIIGGTQDNGTWFINNGEDRAEWKKIFGADGGYCAVADSGTAFYMSYQNGQIYRNALTERGESMNWIRVDPVGGDDYLFIHPFALDPSDTRIMYLPEGFRVWRNSNLAELPLDSAEKKKTMNWRRLDSTGVPAGEGRVSAVGVSRSNPAHRLYYGTAAGGIYRLENADNSNAAGVRISGSHLPRGFVSSIAVDPHDGNKVLVAISSYNLHSLFYTSDGGETWDTVGGNLEEKPNGEGNGPSVGWVAVLRVEDRNVYFAGTTTGLYSTTALNGMNTFWAQEGASTIGNVVVDMIDVRESDGFVAVGTHGRGIYSGHVRSDLLSATVSIAPTLLDFGKIGVGESSYDTVRITNSAPSARNVQVSVPQGSAIFSVISGGGSSLLAPGEARQVVVRFTPGTARIFTEQLLISHDGSAPQTPAAVELAGEGIAKTGGVATLEEPSVIATLSGYPNPFSKTVDLWFALQKGGNVRVVVVGVDGVDVAQLYEGRMEAGTHNLTWHPTDQAAGVYYVRLEAEGERRTLRVILEQ